MVFDKNFTKDLPALYIIDPGSIYVNYDIYHYKIPYMVCKFNKKTAILGKNKGRK